MPSKAAYERFASARGVEEPTAVEEALSEPRRLELKPGVDGVADVVPAATDGRRELEMVAAAEAVRPCARKRGRAAVVPSMPRGVSAAIDVCCRRSIWLDVPDPCEPAGTSGA